MYLLELELRVEADVADLAVEGALGGFVWGGPCAAPQAWEGADGSQPTACLHQRLVLRPCTNTASPGDPPSPTDPSLILWDPHSLPHQFPPPQYYLMSPSSHLHLHNAPMAQQCHRTHGAPWFPNAPPGLLYPHIPTPLSIPPSPSTSSCPPPSPCPPLPTFIVCLELGQGVDSHLAEGAVKQPLGLRLLLLLLPLRCPPRTPPRSPRCLCGHSRGIRGGGGPGGAGSCGRWGLLSCGHTESQWGPPPKPYCGEEGGRAEGTQASKHHLRATRGQPGTPRGAETHLCAQASPP